MPLSLRLAPDEEERLSELAHRTGRSKSFYIREAIREYLDEIEERYWADSVVKEYERTGKQSSPAGQLWDELGV